jgi:phosphoglycolate phosphatase
MPSKLNAAPPSAILFDLDGTLLDTASDIALALQRAMADQGLAAPDVAAVRTMIGKGSPVLVERACAALGVAADERQRTALLDGFFDHYGRLEASGESSALPYDGVRQGLAALQARGVPMAVVTNKFHRFAVPLLTHLDLMPNFRLVVGGDTCERRKPDPQPLQWACSELGIEPARALMVGDSINDVQAARAAGMPVVCVPYGYNEGRDVRTLPCDAFVETLADLPGLLGLSV